ncbi:MAG: GerW family sporulation protein [Deltaproteobacteria bacterium]
MNEHPIQGLMSTAMQSIKDMVDVNTIVGDAVQAPDGTVIIPISKVSFGFAAGGSEFKGDIEEEDSRDRDRDKDKNILRMPFGGGSGAGVSISPIAFLVVNKENIKLMPVNFNTSLDKLLDFIPEMMERLNDSVKKKICMRKEGKSSEGHGKKDCLSED